MVSLRLIGSAFALAAAGIAGFAPPLLAGPGAVLGAAVDIDRGEARPTPIAVFGRAQRTPLNGATRAFERSIGLLVNNSERMVCSAFCVDDAIVATAAHCLFRTATEKPPRLADFQFVRRIQGVAPTGAVRIAGAQANAASQNVLAGSRQLSVKPPIEATRDWAFVRLEKPVCLGAALPVRPGPAEDIIVAARERRLYQVGFHRDFADWRLAIARGCGAARNFEAADWSSIARDFIEADHLILHTCDTGGASSGSPLLIDGASGPEVVGINVGTYVQTRVLVERGEVVHRYRADPVANTGVSAEAFAGQLELFRRAQVPPARLPDRPAPVRGSRSSSLGSR